MGTLFAVIFMILWAGVSLLMAWIFLRQARELTRRIAAIEGTPTSAIASAPTDGPVELTGRVVAGDSGVAPSPILAVPAVWWSSTVSEDIGSSSRTVTSVSRDEDFFIDDGSGALARVSPVGAKTEIEPEMSSNEPEVKERVLGLARLVRRDISPKSLTFSEVVLREGAKIYVIGEATAGEAGPVPAAYRDRPSRVLRVVATADRELLISDRDEAQLLSKLKVRRVGFCIGIAFALGWALVPLGAGVWR